MALDDCAGGRAAGKAVWAPHDAPRVLCPPPFRPFGPPEERVLERCAEALAAIHDAFFDPHSGGAATALAGGSAAELLGRLVVAQESLHFGRA